MEAKNKVRQRDFVFDKDIEVAETHFRGKSIAFNTWSIDLGGFKEMILPEAWSTADVSDCLAVFNHNERDLLGSYKAGTLSFEVKNDGVYTKIEKRLCGVGKTWRCNGSKLQVYRGRGRMDL
jgi:phage head maturation protease